MNYEQNIHYARNFLHKSGLIRSSFLKSEALKKAEKCADEALAQATTDKEFEDLEKIFNRIESMKKLDSVPIG